MITRLEIDGFKSLRDFAVDLDPLTVFIGPNSAGKSNILDALALVSRLATMPIEEAFKQGRGRAIDQFTRHGGVSGSTIRFAVEVFFAGEAPRPVEHDIPCNRYRYELAIARRKLPSGAERFAIEAERLLALDRVSDRWAASHPEFAGMIQHAPEVLETLVQTHNPDTKKSEISPITNELSGYRLLHLDSARMREPSERLGAGSLAPDASNLATVLANLPALTLGEIRADLVSLVPGISSFDVVVDGDAFRIDLELSGGERLPARLVSDGTLRILALLTALRVEPRAAVIGIEEPENGVYPGRLRKLLDYIQETAAQGGETGAAATQLILTTHSPVVLASLRARPQHLRFVDLVRRDGQLVTRARTVGPSASADRGQSSISLREVDELLHAADAEIGQ
jgi:predicted ATPase